MTETAAIRTCDLIKFYGSFQALHGVDLEVQRGEIFGFLGPNGAGKTTTIRCLLDMIRPDGGTARVLGLDPQAAPVAVQARTGYLPGELALDDSLTAEEQLRYLNDLRGGQAEWAGLLGYPDIQNQIAVRCQGRRRVAGQGHDFTAKHLDTWDQGVEFHGLPTV